MQGVAISELANSGQGDLFHFSGCQAHIWIVEGSFAKDMHAFDQHPLHVMWNQKHSTAEFIRGACGYKIQTLKSPQSLGITNNSFGGIFLSL